MQVLKEEMRKRIYEAAIREFSHNGFNRASMREIARNAGMTVGNLYRYFKDKEALFYNVISPAYGSLMELVEECLELVRDGFDSSFFEFLSQQILKISKEHRIELLILFEGSGGTRYEKAKDEIIQIVENFLKGDMQKRLEGKGIMFIDEYIFRVMAIGFVEGMTMIAGRYEDYGQLHKVASQFIAFYFRDMEKRFI